MPRCLTAVKVMAQHDIGSLVVMDHGRMAGLVTFAEVLRALADREGTVGALTIKRHHRPRSADRHAVDRRRWSCAGSCSSAMRATCRCWTGSTLLGVVSFHDVAKAVLEEQTLENQALKSYISDSLA